MSFTSDAALAASINKSQLKALPTAADGDTNKRICHRNGTLYKITRSARHAAKHIDNLNRIREKCTELGLRHLLLPTATATGHIISEDYHSVYDKNPLSLLHTYTDNPARYDEAVQELAQLTFHLALGGITVTGGDHPLYQLLGGENGHYENVAPVVIRDEGYLYLTDYSVCSDFRKDLEGYESRIPKQILRNAERLTRLFPHSQAVIEDTFSELAPRVQQGDLLEKTAESAKEKIGRVTHAVIDHKASVTTEVDLKARYEDQLGAVHAFLTDYCKTDEDIDLLMGEKAELILDGVKDYLEFTRENAFLMIHRNVADPYMEYTACLNSSDMFPEHFEHCRKFVQKQLERSSITDDERAEVADKLIQAIFTSLAETGEILEYKAPSGEDKPHIWLG